METVRGLMFGVGLMVGIVLGLAAIVTIPIVAITMIQNGEELAENEIESAAAREYIMASHIEDNLDRKRAYRKIAEKYPTTKVGKYALEDSR